MLSRLKRVISITWFARRRISGRSTRASPRTPKSSTVKEAITHPYTTAARSVRSVTRPMRASAPKNPPAKVSPAPVGSTTLSIGTAGQVK